MAMTLKMSKAMTLAHFDRPCENIFPFRKKRWKLVSSSNVSVTWFNEMFAPASFFTSIDMLSFLFILKSLQPVWSSMKISVLLPVGDADNIVVTNIDDFHKISGNVFTEYFNQIGRPALNSNLPVLQDRVPDFATTHPPFLFSTFDVFLNTNDTFEK